jgi:hypothetical protein
MSRDFAKKVPEKLGKMLEISGISEKEIFISSIHSSPYSQQRFASEN